MRVEMDKVFIQSQDNDVIICLESNETHHELSIEYTRQTSHDIISLIRPSAAGLYCDINDVIEFLTACRDALKPAINKGVGNENQEWIN